MTVLSESVFDHTFFDAVFRTAARLLAQPDALALGAEIVSREEIRRVNAEFRGVDRATDVLSFPTLSLAAGEVVDPKKCKADTDPETEEVYLGDILLCEEIAREQAAEYGHSYERELGYLFCHAVLHLFGYDHMEAEEQAAMRAKEEAVMSALNLTRGE